MKSKSAGQTAAVRPLAASFIRLLSERGSWQRAVNRKAYNVSSSNLGTKRDRNTHTLGRLYDFNLFLMDAQNTPSFCSFQTPLIHESSSGTQKNAPIKISAIHKSPKICTTLQLPEIHSLFLAAAITFPSSPSVNGGYTDLVYDAPTSFVAVTPSARTSKQR